jgi:hypothetical protein
MNEENYIKGFNEGYSLSKEVPEIADILSKASGDSDRLNGFKDGRSQYINERLKEKRPSWLTSKGFSKDDKEPEKSNDKGLEPER